MKNTSRKELIEIFETLCHDTFGSPVNHKIEAKKVIFEGSLEHDRLVIKVKYSDDFSNVTKVIDLTVSEYNKPVEWEEKNETA